MGVNNRDDESLPQRHGLRRCVKDSGKQVGETAGNGRFNVLGLPGDLVLLVENGFALSVVQPECGVDLAPALHSLLIKFVSAASLTIEGGLEAIADMEQQVDGADGVGIGCNAFAVAVCLKVDDGCACRKDPPVH